MFFISDLPTKFRAVLLAATVLSAINFSTPQAFAQQPPPKISWAFFQNECDAAKNQADDWFRVGNFGYFYFSAGSTPIPECNRAATSSCTETVRFYPKPSEEPYTVACDNQGGCNKRFDQMVEPWAFIPDLADWHARMVDEVIRSTTDDKVDSKISKIEPSRPHFTEVTDVDVYRVFAGLAEAVDKGGTPRPSVINMSFGRLHQPGDAFSSSCPQDRCYDGALSCQIARLLGYLTEVDPDDSSPPTVVVGSAGNDLVDLVPGVFEEVITTGMIDTTKLAAHTGTDPARETPTPWNALMPGNGLCLNLPLEDPHQNPVWTDVPAPSGSSFSTAIMTGLASDLLRNEPDSFLDQLGQGHPWVPREDCTSSGCTFVLTNGVVAFPSPSGKGSAFLHEAVHGDPRQCGMSGLPPKWLRSVLSDPTVDPTSQYDSLPELTADTHRPTPEPRVCIPCVVDVTSPLRGPGAHKAALPPDAVASLSSLPLRQPGWVRLEIDLHGRWPLGGINTLHGLYLRFGAQFRPLKLTRTDLLQIKMGMVDYIDVSGYFRTLDLSQQPSLISIVSREDPPGSREYFYRSTPVFYRQ